MKTFALTALVATTSALPWIGLGECPSNISGMQGVDNSLYAGTWYEYERQMSPLPWWMGWSMMEDMGSCGTQEIWPTADGNIVQYKMRMMWPMGWMGSPKMATKVTADGVQLYELDDPLDWIFDESEEKHMAHVLETDSNNYVAFYICADVPFMDQAMQVVYVYVRDGSYTLPDSVRASIDAKMQALVPSYDSGDSYYPAIGGDSCDYENAQAEVDAYYADKM